MRAVGNQDPYKRRETPQDELPFISNTLEPIKVDAAIELKSYTQATDVFRLDLPQSELTFVPALKSLIRDLVFRKNFKAETLLEMQQQAKNLGLSYNQTPKEILMKGELKSNAFELKLDIFRVTPLISYNFNIGTKQTTRSFYILKDEYINENETTLTKDAQLSGRNSEINEVILFPDLSKKSTEPEVTKDESQVPQAIVTQKPVIELVNNQVISNRKDVTFWSQAYVNNPGVLECIYAITQEGDSRTLSAYIAKAPEYQFSKVPVTYSVENQYHKLLIDNNQTLWIPSIQGIQAWCNYGTQTMPLTILL